MSSDDLLARTRAVLPSWLAVYYAEPIEITHGEGRYVWDGDGNRYLDFFGGILTTMTAHALPEVTKAVAEQAGRIIHSSTLYLNRPMVELAELIASVSDIPDAKVFLTTSGTEANDAALLLASSLRRSNQILALRNSYHGRSFSTIAITGNRNWSPTSLSPFQTYYVHGGQQYRSPFAGLSDGEYIAACVADLREVLDQSGGDIAAFIAEPIQGVGGFTSGPDGLLGAFAEVLREHGILWISDEVQSGWGRTGEHFWGWQASEATPDIVTFAKGVGNGLSMGGVIAPASIMDTLAGQLDLDVRRLAADQRRRAGQPALPARARPAGQRGPARPGAAGRVARGRLADRGRRAREGADDRRRAGPAGHRQPRASRRRSWPTPCWRPASGAACWSARAACTATRCASPHRSR